jgi:hypothetical protein
MSRPTVDISGCQMQELEDAGLVNAPGNATHEVLGLILAVMVEKRCGPKSKCAPALLQLKHGRMAMAFREGMVICVGPGNMMTVQTLMVPALEGIDTSTASLFIHPQGV